MSLHEELIGPPPAKLVIDNVSKWFRSSRQTVHALDNVSLNVGEGEFVCLVGPSGCGKSTLLNLIAGLDYPTQGEVCYEGKPVTEINTDLGYITQNDTVLPWSDVIKTVVFSSRFNSWSSSWRGPK